jgi:hypothetical protein
VRYRRLIQFDSPVIAPQIVQCRAGVQVHGRIPWRKLKRTLKRDQRPGRITGLKPRSAISKTFLHLI